MLIMLFASSTSYAQVIIGGGDWCPGDVEITPEIDVAFKGELEVVTAATPGVNAVTSVNDYKSSKEVIPLYSGSTGNLIANCLQTIDLAANIVVQMEKDGQACEATLAVKSQYKATEKTITQEVSGLSQCAQSAPDLTEEYFKKIAVYDASPYLLKDSKVDSFEKVVGQNGEVAHNAKVAVTVEIDGKQCVGKFEHSVTLNQDKLVLNTEATDKDNPFQCE